MDFTVAETELLRMFDTTDRLILMDSLFNEITNLTDGQFEIALTALDKLTRMSGEDAPMLYNNHHETEV